MKPNFNLGLYIQWRICLFKQNWMKARYVELVAKKPYPEIPASRFWSEKKVNLQLGNRKVQYNTKLNSYGVVTQYRGETILGISPLHYCFMVLADNGKIEKVVDLESIKRLSNYEENIFIDCIEWEPIDCQEMVDWLLMEQPKRSFPKYDI